MYRAVSSSRTREANHVCESKNGKRTEREHGVRKNIEGTVFESEEVHGGARSHGSDRRRKKRRFGEFG